MRIHDKYVLSSFWKNLILGLLAFTLIYITVDFNEQIDNFIDHDATVRQISSYYFFKIPWIVLLVLPVAVLLATVFSLGKMSRDNELTALISSGTPLVRISTSLMVTALAISLLSIAFNEFVVPRANHTAEEIMRVDIEKKRASSSARYKKDLHYQGEDGRTYYAEKYDTELKVMTKVIVQKYEGPHLIERIDAEKGFWDGLKWVFLNGATRKFTDGVETTTEFVRLQAPGLRVKPEDLAKEELEPEEMNYTQLKEYIDKIKRRGGAIDKYRVDLYFKFSFPFTSFLFTVLGISLTAGKRKPSMATGFGLTLLVSFTYYGILRIGQALGRSSVVHPVIGAWAGNVIFCILGGIFLYRANK